MSYLIFDLNAICLWVNIFVMVIVYLFHTVYNLFAFRYDWRYEVIFKGAIPAVCFVAILFAFGLNLISLLGLFYLIPSPVMAVVAYTSVVALDLDPEFVSEGNYYIFMHEKNKSTRPIYTKVYIRDFDECDSKEIADIIEKTLKLRNQLTEAAKIKLKTFRKKMNEVKLIYYYFADYTHAARFYLPVRKLAYLCLNRPTMRKLEGNVIEFPERIKINKKKFIDSVMVEGEKSKEATTFMIENYAAFEVLANLDRLDSEYEKDLDIKHFKARLGRYKKKLATAITDNQMDNAELSEGGVESSPTLNKSNIAAIFSIGFGVVCLVLFLFMLLTTLGVI